MVAPLDDPKGTTEFDDGFAARYVEARRLAYAIVGDRTTADDLAVEALVRTLNRWHRVRLLRHRDAWVLRAAAILAIDAARRGAVGTAAPADAAVEGDDLVALDRSLVDALVRLPSRDRIAIVLVEVARCPAEDAAAAMNVSIASLRKHIRRGLDRLDDEVPAAANPWRSAHALG